MTQYQQTRTQLEDELEFLREKVTRLESASSPNDDWDELGIYRSLVESANDAMFTKDVTGRYLTTNAEFLRRVGKPTEDVIGKNVFHVFPPDLALLLDSEDQEVLQTGRALGTEHKVQTVDGIRVLSIRKLPLRDEDANVVGLIGISRDVQDTKRAERALIESEQKALEALDGLQHAQDNLVQAEKLAALGELVAGVAHELNNPLTGVLGVTQLLLMRDPAPDLKDKLRIVEQGALRASRIVQNLLAFSRKQRVEPELIDLNEILRQTLELKVYDLLGNQVELELDLAPVLPEVLADVGQMQSVFLNLVNNAQDAIVAHSEKGTIRIKTEFTNEKIRIEIADDGPGVPPDILKKIFDPFFTTKPVGKGTGLGLSICHGIVQEHGATMSVESEPGAGATFIIEFAPGSPLETAPLIIKEESEVIVIGGGRILVIDDEEVVREVLRSALSRDGYEVETLSSPREALPKLERGQYDLILADLKNPDMSGKEFFQELSTRMPDMISRVIFITGDAASPNAREFLKGAGRPVIEKPFELQALQRQVAKAMVS